MMLWMKLFDVGTILPKIGVNYLHSFIVSRILMFAMEVMQLRSNTCIEDGLTELKLLLGRIDTTQISSSIRA